MGVVGAVCGLILYYLWVAVIIGIQFTFFAEPNATGAFVGPLPLMIRTWLIAGTLPFFIIFGHYWTISPYFVGCGADHLPLA